MEQKNLLVIITVILVGIFTIMVVNQLREPPSPGEQIANSVSETIEEIGDEIDDAN